MLRTLIASVLKISTIGLIMSSCLASAALTTPGEFTTERFLAVLGDRKGKPPPVFKPIELFQDVPALWTSLDGQRQFAAQYHEGAVSWKDITRHEEGTLVAIHAEEENESLLVSLGKTTMFQLNTGWEPRQKLIAYVLDASPAVEWKDHLRKGIKFTSAGIKSTKATQRH